MWNLNKISTASRSLFLRMFKEAKEHCPRQNYLFRPFLLGQTAESCMPPGFRTAKQYSKNRLVVRPQGSMLIGLLGLVPAVDTLTMLYTATGLFLLGVTVFGVTHIAF